MKAKDSFWHVLASFKFIFTIFFLNFILVFYTSRSPSIHISPHLCFHYVRKSFIVRSQSYHTRTRLRLARRIFEFLKTYYCPLGFDQKLFFSMWLNYEAHIILILYPKGLCKFSLLFIYFLLFSSCLAPCVLFCP